MVRFRKAKKARKKYAHIAEIDYDPLVAHSALSQINIGQVQDGVPLHLRLGDPGPAAEGQCLQHRLHPQCLLHKQVPVSETILCVLFEPHLSKKKMLSMSTHVRENTVLCPPVSEIILCTCSFPDTYNDVM